MRKSVHISAVIATRNRCESLCRLLKSLRSQEYQLQEIVIVDSSDTPVEKEIHHQFPDLPIRYELSAVISTCCQRNSGIQIAGGSYILLCDDDLEFPPAYVKTLVGILEQDNSIGAITGVCLDLNDEGFFKSSLRPINLPHLLWQTLFQLTVWGDIEQAPSNPLARILHSLLLSFYRHRGNSFSFAGWPLVTQMGPLFRTSVFSLGGSLIRREWLLQSPFDEILDPYGIGDNYGVALKFPQERPIVVTTDTFVLHHKELTNRLPLHLAYFRRVLALHYFMKTNDRFSLFNRILLLWSLVGNALALAVRRESPLRRATLKAMKLILLGQNPYVCAWKAQQSTPVSPGE
jgi:glycosyltransferase involved in cell wall biosynthesis